jgi:hypothetical protein
MVGPILELIESERVRFSVSSGRGPLSLRVGEVREATGDMVMGE